MQRRELIGASVPVIAGIAGCSSGLNQASGQTAPTGVSVENVEFDPGGYLYLDTVRYWNPDAEVVEPLYATQGNWLLQSIRVHNLGGDDIRLPPYSSYKLKHGNGLIDPLKRFPVPEDKLRLKDVTAAFYLGGGGYLHGSQRVEAGQKTNLTLLYDVPFPLPKPPEYSVRLNNEEILTIQGGLNVNNPGGNVGEGTPTIPSITIDTPTY